MPLQSMIAWCVLWKQTKGAPTRVREFLIDFAKEYGKPKEDGLYIKNFLTHDDIAKITATSRQTVTSVLNELRNKGILDYNSKELIISYEQLRAFLGN